jgi:hypothetical protein
MRVPAVVVVLRSRIIHHALTGREKKHKKLCTNKSSFCSMCNNLSALNAGLKFNIIVSCTFRAQQAKTASTVVRFFHSNSSFPLLKIKIAV